MEHRDRRALKWTAEAVAAFAVTPFVRKTLLVAGGSNTSSLSLATAEVYDPGSGTWSATVSMAAPRRYHTVTLLDNGKVLVAGGANNSSAYARADLYTP
ncbi:kelch repeat-containing protein [Corallococcus aberystwythensis]|uniref:Kelch-like protein n=1 Tax=Corallococcus aberystwythensis TaxID=2316722 RepID=A0A3A8QKX1_9BACT|nr:kelch repeat-containing protein [Corallococcus aberystwythensis]RKH67570.1 hypothetical protein D7W81_13710 [Corallococcus aberystwythensis]